MNRSFGELSRASLRTPRHNLSEGRHMDVIRYNRMLDDNISAVQKDGKQCHHRQPNCRDRQFAAPIAWACLLLLCHFAPLAVAGYNISILDGDTVRNEDTQEKIRLYGIDAPELSQPHGRESGFALADAIKGRPIWQYDLGTGKYGRTIVLMEYKDKSHGTTVQAAMIRGGWAWVYPQYCKRPECESWKRLERIAREQGRGLWADDDPVPPWEWRRQ